jgi:outer membrane receptor protein involved in Fe transport
MEFNTRMNASRSLAFVALAASWCVPAEAAPRHRISLPGGPLSGALIALGRQAGISIGISDPSLARMRVPAVAGNLTVDQALGRLLGGTGARAIFIDRSTVRIVAAPAPPKARPVPRVQRPAVRPAPPPPPARLREEQEAQEEIVVTAAKRPIPLRSYPGPAAVIDGNDAALAAGIPNSESLVRRLPSLSSTSLGTGRNKLFVRGVADSSFTGPTQSTVGQYFGETRLNYNAPDPDLRLLDVDHVELLPGPQGTLYGAGSMGGIIRVVPNPPSFDRVEGSLSVGASATERGEPGYDASAIVNLPLSRDGAALRLLGYGLSEGGYIDDLGRKLDDVNRVRVFGGRAAVRVKPSNGWIVDLGVTAQSIRGEDAQYADREGPPLTRGTFTQQNFKNDYWLGQLVGSKTWSNYRLVFAGSAVAQQLREIYDLRAAIVSPGSAPTPIVIEENHQVGLLSFEGRLSMQDPNGTGWMIGTSLIRNRSVQHDRFGLPPKLFDFDRVRNVIFESTLFGDATFPLFSAVTATVGGRVNHSVLDVSEPESLNSTLLTEQDARGRKTQTLFLPSAAVAAQLMPDLLLFARYQEAFRPGGIDLALREVRSFRSDRVRAAEIGLRYGVPGRGRFDASISAAYTRWADVQADVVNTNGRVVTGNIGDGRIYTLDMSFGWRPLPGLSIDGAAVFNDSRIEDPVPIIFIGAEPVDRSPLPNVARYNARLSAEYRKLFRLTSDLRLWAAARYAGKSILGIGIPLNKTQGKWTNFELGGRFTTGRHAFSLEVSNALGEEGNRFSFGSPYTLRLSDQITPLRPRTVRLSYGIAF